MRGMSSIASDMLSNSLFGGHVALTSYTIPKPAPLLHNQDVEAGVSLWLCLSHLRCDILEAV